MSSGSEAQNTESHSFTSTLLAGAVFHISPSHETHPNQGVTNGERPSASGSGGDLKRQHSAVCGSLLSSGLHPVETNGLMKKKKSENQGNNNNTELCW